MMQAFKDGPLTPLLEAVRNDDTLCMEMRGADANIYYRGGSLYRISERSPDSYAIGFDPGYCIRRQLPANPSVAEASNLIRDYKQEMDYWLHSHRKGMEREIQQLMVRLNNAAGEVSRATDYYIVDVEYADAADSRARFDMVAFKWPSRPAARKNTSCVSLALIELKVGDASLAGASGVIKHLDDFSAFVADKKKLDAFAHDMEQVFQQKCELGLITGLSERQHKVNVSSENLEIIFAFAEHDPEKSKLGSILRSVNPDDYTFPIYLSVGSLIGYTMYQDCLVSISEYLKR